MATKKKKSNDNSGGEPDGVGIPVVRKSEKPPSLLDTVLKMIFG